MAPVPWRTMTAAMDMIRQLISHPRLRAALRVLLSPYFGNGVMAALGLLLISGLVRLWLGPEAAAAASVGVIVCIPPDQASPKHGKIWLLLPSAILGLPLFAAVQALHASPLCLGLLLVSATFLAFLAGAWGKRGLPIVMSLMFAALFSMAMPRQASEASVLSGADAAAGHGAARPFAGWRARPRCDPGPTRTSIGPAAVVTGHAGLHQCDRAGGRRPAAG